MNIPEQFRKLCDAINPHAATLEEVMDTFKMERDRASDVERMIAEIHDAISLEPVSHDEAMAIIRKHREAYLSRDIDKNIRDEWRKRCIVAEDAVRIEQQYHAVTHDERMKLAAQLADAKRELNSMRRQLNDANDSQRKSDERRHELFSQLETAKWERDEAVRLRELFEAKLGAAEKRALEATDGMVPKRWQELAHHYMTKVERFRDRLATAERKREREAFVDGATWLADEAHKLGIQGFPRPVRDGVVAVRGWTARDEAARRYPLPVREVPRVVTLSDGWAFEIRDGILWHNAGDGNVFYKSGSTISAFVTDMMKAEKYADAALLCDLAARPTEEVK